MSTAEHEPTVAERVSERPSVKPSALRQVRPRDLGFRFLTGAATSILAGLATLALGSRVGGIFLAFPAILAASLTLIEEQDDGAEAREDARGAIVGGCALAVFAAIAALTFGHVSGAVALALAAVGWCAAAFALYVMLWWG